MYYLIFAIVIIAIYPQSTIGLVPHEISFLVLSQQTEFHRGIAQQLKKSIIEQALKIENHEHQSDEIEENVFLTNEDFSKDIGSWAITPLFKHMKKSILKSNKIKWLIICEDQSNVNVSVLVHNLNKEDSSIEQYFGYPLHDKEATIIHHFAFFKNPSKFLYPYVRAGIALTIPLVERLIKLLYNKSYQTDFFIDPAHEFAMLAWNNGQGITLTPKPYFCHKLSNDIDCAIYTSSHVKCKSPVDPNKMLYAIKTCHKFHDIRVPVVKNTWGKYTKHLRIYSDVEDVNIPTIKTNIPNTETGHCTKSLKIFKLIAFEMYQNESLKDIEWIVLADDDTILSPSALANNLPCFESEQDIYLGERYGYQLNTQDGYNYITGGGGIVINRNVLIKLITSCECPSLTSPDDMIIAACLHNLDIAAIHSSLFHQARPNDYPSQVLNSKSISFHKHWQIDPYHIYNKWFRRNDHHYFYGHRKHINQESHHINLDAHFCDNAELQNSNLQSLTDSEIMKHSDL